MKFSGDRRSHGPSFVFLLGAAALATASASCQPGALQCEDPPECKSWMTSQRVQNYEDAGTPTTPIDTAVAGNTDTVAAATICPSLPTIADVEKKLFLPKCGMSGCHGAMDQQTDLATPGAAQRLGDAMPKGTFCKSSKIVDKADPTKSFLLLKLKSVSPKCPDGASGGPAMPVGTPLTATELGCVENYVKAVAAR